MVQRQIVKRFWNERAALADDPRSVTLDKESAASVTREVKLYQAWMFRHLGASGYDARGAVVDLGCGNGDWTVVLAKRAQQVTAVDFAEKFLEHCESRLSEIDGAAPVRFVQADVAEYEFDAPCDLVVAGAVIQYLDDDDAKDLLARICSALTPTRGALYLRTTVAKKAERRETNTDSFQGVYRSTEWYLSALESCGLTVHTWSTATDYVADELGRKWAGPVWPVIAWPLRLIRRTYRARRPTDVFVCIATPTRAAITLMRE